MDNQTTNQTTTIPIGDEVLEIKKLSDLREEDASQDIGHDKLLSCLYFVFDAFERAAITFFLVKETARFTKNEDQLRGDHVSIGVRRNEWQNDAKDLLFAYFNEERIEQTENLPDRITYVWQNIPFTIYFYEDNECITALVPIVYEHESWFIPNQFERFEKEFDSI